MQDGGLAEFSILSVLSRLVRCLAASVSRTLLPISRPYYTVSQKIPPEDLWQFFQNGWEFFNQILHA